PTEILQRPFEQPVLVQRSRPEQSRPISTERTAFAVRPSRLPSVCYRKCPDARLASYSRASSGRFARSLTFIGSSSSTTMPHSSRPAAFAGLLERRRTLSAFRCLSTSAAVRYDRASETPTKLSYESSWDRPDLLDRSTASISTY